MPASCVHRDGLLIMTVVGLAENEEIGAALREGLAAAPAQVRLRLLWDARQSVTLVTSDDVAYRVGLVAALAERGVLERVALLLDAERQRSAYEIFGREMPKVMPGLPGRTFSDEEEALAWLAGG